MPWCARDTSPGGGTWPSPDQPQIGNGVVRGTIRARGDEGRAGASEAGDARHAHGLQRFGEAQHQQDDGQAAGSSGRRMDFGWVRPEWLGPDDPGPPAACTEAARGTSGALFPRRARRRCRAVRGTAVGVAATLFAQHGRASVAPHTHCWRSQATVSAMSV
jgi:hypothetical protein